MVCENCCLSLKACSLLNYYFFWVHIPTLLSKLLWIINNNWLPWLLPCHHSTSRLYTSVWSLRHLRKSSCLMPHAEPEKKIYIRVPLLHSVQGVEPGLELDRTMGERVSLTVSFITSGGTCKVEISWSYGGAVMESSKCETTCQDLPKAPFIMSVAVHLQTDIIILNKIKRLSCLFPHTVGQ